MDIRCIDVNKLEKFAFKFYFNNHHFTGEIGPKISEFCGVCGWKRTATPADLFEPGDHAALPPHSLSHSLPCEALERCVLAKERYQNYLKAMSEKTLARLGASAMPLTLMVARETAISKGKRKRTENMKLNN